MCIRDSSSFDNMHVFRFREFGLKTPIHALKFGVFIWKIGEGVGRYWPPTNSFLLSGVYTSVSNLVKIDEEMRLWECPQTNRHTHAQTQNDFIICPMLYAIAMGQIIKLNKNKKLSKLLKKTSCKHPERVAFNSTVGIFQTLLRNTVCKLVTKTHIQRNIVNSPSLQWLSRGCSNRCVFS